MLCEGHGARPRRDGSDLRERMPEPGERRTSAVAADRARCAHGHVHVRHVRLRRRVAYDVGVPAKSGVSGGIMASIPEKMGIGVFSPGLDPYGNSVRGVNVCHEVSERLGLHVFATEAEDAMMGPGG